jgi:hypothetical protein
MTCAVRAAARDTTVVGDTPRCTTTGVGLGTPRRTCSTCSPWPAPTRSEDVVDLLYRFYRRCAQVGLPELERLATTVQTWWPQILAFIHTGITNAGSEGTNRVIKTVARDAYGFRNARNPRLRTRCATTRRNRGHLGPR